MEFRNCLKKLLCIYLSVALICCSFGIDKKKAYASTGNITDVADCYHALSLIGDDSCITEISDKDIDTAADAVLDPEPEDLGITYTQEGKALHEYGYYKSTNPVNLCDCYMYTKFTEVNDDTDIKGQNSADKSHNYTQPSDQIAQEGKSWWSLALGGQIVSGVFAAASLITSIVKFNKSSKIKNDINMIETNLRLHNERVHAGLHNNISSVAVENILQEDSIDSSISLDLSYVSGEHFSENINTQVIKASRDTLIYEFLWTSADVCHKLQNIANKKIYSVDGTTLNTCLEYFNNLCNDGLESFTSMTHLQNLHTAAALINHAYPEEGMDADALDRQGRIATLVEIEWLKGKSKVIKNVKGEYDQAKEEISLKENFEKQMEDSPAKKSSAFRCFIGAIGFLVVSILCIIATVVISYYLENDMYHYIKKLVVSWTSKWFSMDFSKISGRDSGLRVEMKSDDKTKIFKNISSGDKLEIEEGFSPKEIFVAADESFLYNDDVFSIDDINSRMKPINVKKHVANNLASVQQMSDDNCHDAAGINAERSIICNVLGSLKAYNKLNQSQKAIVDEASTLKNLYDRSNNLLETFNKKISMINKLNKDIKKIDFTRISESDIDCISDGLSGLEKINVFTDDSAIEHINSFVDSTENKINQLIASNGCVSVESINNNISIFVQSSDLDSMIWYAYVVYEDISALAEINNKTIKETEQEVNITSYKNKFNELKTNTVSLYKEQILCIDDEDVINSAWISIQEINNAEDWVIFSENTKRLELLLSLSME